MDESIVDRSIVKEKPRRTAGQKRQLKLLLFTLLSLVIIFIAAYCLLWPRQESYFLSNYVYSVVGKKDFHNWVNSTGTIKPRSELSLTSPLAGEAGPWLQEPGRMVKKGEPLLVISNERLALEIKEAQNSLLLAELDLKRSKAEEEYEIYQLQQQVLDAQERLLEAEENLFLSEELYNLDLINYKELEHAQGGVQKAKEETERLDLYRQIKQIQMEANLAMAETRYRNALENLQEMELLFQARVIKAPQDGYLASVRTDEGDIVGTGFLLATFIADRGLLYEGQVAVEDSQALEIGQEAIIRGLGEDIPARVSFISALVTEDMNTVEIGLFPEEQDALRANVRVSAQIKVDRYPDCLFLPRGPYLASGERLFVYLVKGERAYQQDVFFGMTEGNYIVIERGLEEGDLVITGSYEDFKRFKEIDIDPEGGRESD